MSHETESAPQTLEEKTRKPERQQWTRARIKLSQLKEKRGFKVLESDASGPLRVEIEPMDSRWTWRRAMSGGEWFELEG